MKVLKMFAICALVFIFGMSAYSQTNTVDGGKTAGSWEFTIGGGGISSNSDNTVGFDVSVSTNPFTPRPEVWVGVVQGLYWEPSFAGSTDIFVDWSQAIFPSKLNDSVYINVGWSGGCLYGDYNENPSWRTGPEFTLQFYPSDNAFIYGGVNYDVFSSDGAEGGFRYSIGIGLAH